MASAWAKFRKAIGFDPDETTQDRVTRGESVVSEAYIGDLPTLKAYIEPEPSVADYFREIQPTWNDVGQYMLSLVPCITWLPRYNGTWLIGDLVAGITVGIVVIPQGMAYSLLAELPPEYGLYSSFVGVIIYWIFATSKDITIGPVAVMSTLTGEIIRDVQSHFPEYSGQDIAATLAILSGAITFFLGAVRLGFIVEFIPLPAIAAFMTGSAVNIIAGQVKSLLGISNVNTHDATYLTIIRTLRQLPTAQIDAAMGLTALAMLYIIRSACQYAGKRYPHRAKLFFFLSTLRTAFVILLYTMISWLVNMNRRDDPRFDILGHVPRGFKHMGVPNIHTGMLGDIAPSLPGAVIVLLIEHIAISKSFGRVNNYTINPSQELIAIGITNVFGPFFGAYPATGSFSRTAIKSKAGVRTPLAGVITGVLVILAIYALPPVFFYIPSSSLAGVIIHAVGDLITPPKTLYRFWRASPPEVVIFFAGVIGSVFGNIEIGVYVTVAVTGGLMLFRLAKANGEFIGRVRVRASDGSKARDIWVPFNHADGTNPDVPVEQPAPGVFVFRMSYPYLYPNAFHYTEQLVDHVFANTRKTSINTNEKPGDRPWNDPGPRRKKVRSESSSPWWKFGKNGNNNNNNSQQDDSTTSEHDIEDEYGIDKKLPTLKAIILDFASVAHIDVTSAQNLYDVRNQLDRYASPDQVEWHFANVQSPWVKRALASVGFGRPNGEKIEPIFTVVEVGTGGSYRIESDDGQSQTVARGDIEQALRALPVLSIDRQAFHVDVSSAVDFVVRRLNSLNPDASDSDLKSKSQDGKEDLS